MPLLGYIVLIITGVLVLLLLKLILIFIRDLFTNPISAFLLLLATVGFYVAFAGIVALGGHYLQHIPITAEAMPWVWGMLILGVIAGNLGYWGRVRWNDHLVARRMARTGATAARLQDRWSA